MILIYVFTNKKRTEINHAKMNVAFVAFDSIQEEAARAAHPCGGV